MSSNPLQAYVDRAGTFKAVGRSSLSSFAGFASFTADDVFAGVAKPQGRLDPGPQNVGCRIPDVALTTVTGDYTASPGEVISGKMFLGRLLIPASGAAGSVTDCVLLGGYSTAPTASDGMVSSASGSGNSMRGWVFTYVEIRPEGNESIFRNNVDGGNHTFRFCDIRRGVDGMHWNYAGGGGLLDRCRVSYGYYMSWWNTSTGAVRTSTFTDYGGKVWPAPFLSQSSGDTHSDGVQIAIGGPWEIDGCYIGGPRTSAVSGAFSHLDPTVQADYNKIVALQADASFQNSAVIVNSSASSGTNKTQLTLHRSILEGGAATLNLAQSSDGSDLLDLVTIDSVLIVPNSFGFKVYATTGMQATLRSVLTSDTRTAITPVYH